MSAGINAGSVFVSIRANMGPFQKQLAGLQKQIGAIGKKLQSSMNFSGQAGKATVASQNASRALLGLNQSFQKVFQSATIASQAVGKFSRSANYIAGKVNKATVSINNMAAASTASATKPPIGPSWVDRADKFGRRIYYARRAVQQATSSLFQMSAVILGPIALSTRVFMGFEDQMKRVQILTGANTATFGALTKEARRLGATTSFTAAQAAEGMRELAQAGYSAQEILSSVSSVLALARIGDMGLGESAKIIAKTSKAFGLLAEDAGFVADVISKAASSSSTSVRELSLGFRYVASTANQLNQSIEETATLLAVLADRGIPASTAGRTLNQAFKQLLQKQDKIQQLYGVILKDPATGGMRKFTEIVKDLSASLANKSDFDKQAEIFELFGVLGGRAIAPLIAAGDSLDEMGKKVRDNVGFAETYLRQLEDTLGGAFRRMKSSLEELAIAVTTALQPVLTKLFDDIRAWAIAIAKNPEMVKKWATELFELGKTLLGVAVALKALGYALVGVQVAVEVFKGWHVVTNALGTAFGSTASKLTSKLLPAIASLGAIDLSKLFKGGLFKNLFKGLVAAARGGWAKVGTIAFAVIDKITIAMLGAVSSGAAALGVFAAAFASVGYLAYKIYKYFDDTASIEEAKKSIKEMQGYYDKMTQEDPESFADATNFTKNIKAEIEAMKRRGKTHAEINKAIKDREASLREQLKKSTAVYRELKSARQRDGSDKFVQGTDLIAANIAQVRAQLTALSQIDPWAAGQEQVQMQVEEWYKLKKSIEETTDAFAKYRKDRAAKKEEASFLGEFSATIDIDPKKALKDIDVERFQTSFQIKALEDTIESLKKIRADSEKLAAKGEVLFSDFDWKNLLDGIKDSQEEIKKLETRYDALGKIRKKALEAGPGLADRQQAELQSIQDKRNEVLRKRAFDALLKKDPKAAEAVAAKRLLEIEEKLQEAQRKRLEALAKADQGDLSAKKEAEALLAIEKARTKEVYAAQDALAAARATPPEEALKSMSIGFFGSSNPLEMLGAASIKTDQRLLKETMKSNKYLKNISDKIGTGATFGG